jgi:hypothetical protein
MYLVLISTWHRGSAYNRPRPPAVYPSLHYWRFAESYIKIASVVVEQSTKGLRVSLSLWIATFSGSKLILSLWFFSTQCRIFAMGIRPPEGPSFTRNKDLFPCSWFEIVHSSTKDPCKNYEKKIFAYLIKSSHTPESAWTRLQLLRHCVLRACLHSPSPRSVMNFSYCYYSTGLIRRVNVIASIIIMWVALFIFVLFCLLF